MHSTGSKLVSIPILVKLYIQFGVKLPSGCGHEESESRFFVCLGVFRSLIRVIGIQCFNRHALEITFFFCDPTLDLYLNVGLMVY